MLRQQRALNHHQVANRDLQSLSEMEISRNFLTLAGVSYPYTKRKEEGA